MTTTWGRQTESTVVFLHGAADSRKLGPAHADDLTAAGASLVTFDRPGYGLSARHVGRRLADSVDDLRQVLDELGIERCIVAAWSAGAAFALAAGVHLPDRVQAIRLVAPLAPVDSEVGTSQLPEGQASRLKMLSRLPVNQRQLSRLVHFTIRSEVKRRRADPEAFLHRMADRSPADRQALEDPEVWAVSLANVVSAVTQGGGGWADDVSVVLTPWGIDLSTVEQPVQLWHGTEDLDVGPVASRYFADRLPNCSLTEVEGGGHLGTLFGLWPRLLAPLSTG